MRRYLVLSAMMTFGLSVSWIYGAPQGGQQPAPIDPANFTGAVTPHPTTDIRTLRYEFSAGARTNWPLPGPASPRSRLASVLGG